MRNLTKTLLEKPSYLKSGANIIASRFSVSINQAQKALEEAKILSKNKSEVRIRQFIGYDYNTPGKYIVLGCVHAPFHKRDMMEAVIKLINDNKNEIVGLIIAGDFLDMNSLSSHDKGKKPLTGVTLDWEYEEGNKLLDKLLTKLPKNLIKAYIYGNHEDRYNRYMSDIDNSKLGSALQSPVTALKLIERGFEVNTDWKQAVITLGKYLDVCHGEFFNTHTAKKHIDTYRRSMLYYHTHRIQQYIEGATGGFNGGSLADFNSPVFGYASRAMKASWMNGFNTVDIDKEGFYHIQQIICYNNKFVYGNKTYSF